MRKGSTVPMEIREKIRQTCLRKGIMSPNTKGKKLKPRSIEHRRKIGERSKGENCSFWKGGRTTLVKAIKNTFYYKEWRRQIFERDNYTCQFCSIRGGVELAPDHIKAFSVILKNNQITTVLEAEQCAELWDINNGRTLCHPCHKTTDTYGWNIYNKRQAILLNTAVGR